MIRSGETAREGYSGDASFADQEEFTPSEVDGPLAWQVEALCAQTDPELFFPSEGKSAKAPKRICGACAVRAVCLQYALDRNEEFGVWGGLSARERRALIRRQRK